MPQIISYSHDILRVRHGLSVHQINSIFGKKAFEESFEDKTSALENVAEFIKVTDALTSEGISFVPLKGPVLSYRIYGDATVREYCDLDLMVDLSSVRRAKDLLIGLGYEPVGYRFPDRKIGQKIVVSHVHHILFTHRTHDLRVELHWRLFQTPPIRFSKVDDLVTQNLSEMTFAGRTLRILSVELELLYLIMHGGIHYWRRLKWLVDINKFLRNCTVDWGKFKAMALELRASRLVSLANFLLAEYFPSGPSIPWGNEDIPFMKAYAIGQINEVDEPERETIAMKMSRLRFSFHLYPGLMYKLRRVRSAVIFYLYHAFRKVDHSIA